CGQLGCLESKVNFEKILSKFNSSILKENPILIGEKDFEYILRISKFDNFKELSRALQKIGKAITIGASIVDSNKIILAGDILRDAETFKNLEKHILDNTFILKKENISFMEDYVQKRKKAPGILILKKFYNC
ncbi:MAG: hypothetical protein ACRCZ2_10390, partial [Fusobacteriaceae bacterium]